MKRWPTKPLGEICVVDWGNTELTKSAYVEGAKYLAVSAAGCDGRIGHKEHAKHTPVLSAIGAHCGRMFLPEEDFTAIKNTITLTPREGICTGKFLYQLLGYAELPKRGAAQPFIAKADVQTFKVPVPPLAEQERIVKLLDEADDLRKLRAQADTRTAQLIPALFHDMFGDPLAHEGKWPEVLFQEVTDRITYGFTCPMQHLSSGVPIITAKNVLNGYIDFEDVHYAESAEFTSLTAKSKPRRGDILITKDGTIGRCSPVNVDFPFCINQSVALVQPKHDKVTPVYLSHLVLYPSVNALLNGMGKGQALKHLQITELAKLPIPLPPISRQIEFAERVSEIRSLESAQAASHRRTEDLFQSMLHKAFNGEL